MARPLRNLPLIQNWDCHQCGNCCTDYWVPVTEEERKRIEAQGWSELPEFRGKPLFVKYSAWSSKYRLAQVEGDRCIFLDQRGLCKIHGKFGSTAKPFACQIYPYVLVPVEDGYRLSFRYACPSATHNKGRPVSEQRGELKAMAEGLEQWHRENHEEPVVGEVPPPPLQPGQKVGWKDLLRFVAALQNIVTQQAEPFPKRLLRCLALARLCRQATFDKITGSRLREFLELVVPALDAELPQDLQALAAPSWVGRILFRSFLSIFLRKDQGVRRGLRARGVLPFLFGIWRMTRGTGTLPQLQQGLPNKTFTEMEEPFGPLEPTSLELLQRYYAIKLESLQFCGPTFFDYPFWDGLEMLLLTFPMVLWLARGYRELGQPESIHRALNIIDENFGYSPLLRSVRHRYSLSILRSRGELDRLIAWYAR